jgi:hypothetical protein
MVDGVRKASTVLVEITPTLLFNLGLYRDEVLDYLHNRPFFGHLERPFAFSSECRSSVTSANYDHATYGQ